MQENERLYSELEKLRKELKSSQAQLFHDNQQLRKELLNTGYEWITVSHQHTD